MSSKTALFVIDIQNDLATNPKTRIPHADRLKTTGEAILKAARSGLDQKTRKTSPSTIVFVQHEESPESGGLVRGTEPWELVFKPRAGVEDELLVGKTTGDTFESNPDLAQKLRNAGVTAIIAFGIQSECCVEATCRGALKAGFSVSVLSGAHSTYDDGGKTAVEIEREVEDRLSSEGVRVVGWEEQVKEWEEK